jgi:CDP-paratose 2-epimerase
VAHFAIRAALDKPITLYGDGKQVRDLLYADDLVRLYDTLWTNAGLAAGKIYNAGGGPDNTSSLLEMVSLLETALKKRLQVKFASERPGDQRIFVADVSKLREDYGWYPRIRVETGLERMLAWIQSHSDLILKVLEERASQAKKAAPRTLSHSSR